MEVKTYSLEEVKKRNGLYRTYHEEDEIKTGAFLFKSENGTVTYAYNDSYYGVGNQMADDYIFKKEKFVEVNE
jgi:hypothetical protein